VCQAAALARDDPSGDRRLVAYLTACEGADIDGDELRCQLRESLPEYMIPSTFVVVDALPLTPNGKIDRRALPALEPDRAPSSEDSVRPRGPIEEALVEIWGELFSRRRVGVLHNFFELGGHSLVAARLLARLRDTFGVELSLREFFDAPTVASLSRLIERELAAGVGLVAPPIRPVGRDRPLPASFAQHRLWFLDQLEPGSAAYNVPVAVRLVGELDAPSLGRALNEVVRRHEILRTTFVSRTGIPHQVIAPSFHLLLPVTDLSALPEVERRAESERRLREEARLPFDLARGPLIRAGLLRLGDREHVLHLTVHHIAADGWSMDILTREAAALYEAFRRGEISPLPEPALQYADYTAWQRHWLQGEVLRTQLDYWKRQLAGVSTLRLSTDRPRPAASTGRGGARSLLLPTTLLVALQALGRHERATLFMTLLAAFEVLLHRYSGQDDVAVGTPIAGRTRSEIESLIGLFINTLVLRVDLSGNPSFRELLRRTREVVLGAYAHQDLPFEQLVGVLHPERHASRTPLFQVMFALQNAPPPSKSPELELTPIDADSGTAKFDLTLIAAEDERGLQTNLEFSSDLFEPATADHMLGHFRALLEGIAADPDQPIGSLPMLLDEERRLLLGQAGDEGVDDLASELDDLSDVNPDSFLKDVLSEDEATE
jgi:hypothetical protein